MTDKIKSAYKDLQEVRIALQDLKIKKTGKVNFKQVNYTYYELADFLPAINMLCLKHDLITHFSIIPGKHGEKAVLTIHSTLNPNEKISFISPTAESNSLGDALKNLGGKITYMRRYMLMIAFEMVESDSIEAIKRDLADELPADNVKEISEAKDFATLTSICGKLKEKYKPELIKPYYDTRKEELEEGTVKKEKK